MSTNSHTLSCMEIWGGNAQTQKAITIPGFDIWISSLPHANQEQGGDIYYISSCGAGNVARLSLADVAGHGEASAYLAKRLRHLMHRYINTVDQQEFAHALNRDFIKLSNHGRYATALLTAYHTETDHMVICNAGHPRPLLYRASSSHWDFIDHNAARSSSDIYNLPLGIIPNTDYQQYVLKLWPADSLVIYTDAVVEARNPEGEQLGETGLKILLEGLQDMNAEDTGKMLEQQLLNSYMVHDDLTIIILTHNASNPIVPSWKDRLQELARITGLSS